MSLFRFLCAIFGEPKRATQSRPSVSDATMAEMRREIADVIRRYAEFPAELPAGIAVVYPRKRGGKQ